MSPAKPTETRIDPLQELLKVLNGRKLRVLLADDNSNNRDVARWQLDELGCPTDAVTNGREALEAMMRRPYDLVLMDCRMPEMDGYEATRQIRRHEGSARHTKIVAMTAHALAEDSKKCLAAGMDDYITKPVRLETLAAAIRRVLSAPVDPSAPQPAPVAPPGTSGSSVAVGEAPAVDATTMASLHAKGDLLKRLIKIFNQEVPEQLEQIAHSLRQHDTTNAALIAHNLKGTAATFGAARMREFASEIEQTADAGKAEKAAVGLERLRAECDRVQQALEAEQLTG
jgi:CheY-like chemotaxis protein/HPt (histidine-containing phosphotransfer) domain-containing protein